jgi:hypothetical protein
MTPSRRHFLIFVQGLKAECRLVSQYVLQVGVSKLMLGIVVQASDMGLEFFEMYQTVAKFSIVVHTSLTTYDNVFPRRRSRSRRR